jgi:hypothetical protein
MDSITNLATAWNFEIISDKLNIYTCRVYR